jgi:hypothetical protein
MFEWFRKALGGKTDTSEEQPIQQGRDGPSESERRRAQAEERNADQMSRFRTEVVGDLREPEVRKGALFWGWILALSLPTVFFFILHWSGQTVLASFVSVILLALLFFVPGIRKIPTVHCGLLYNLGRRTRIGFWEGWVWIPWMTGGRLKIFNVERFSYDIPREDNWTKDQMHLVFDIVFRFSVIPVIEKKLWENFFWYFHCWLESDTYYSYVLDKKVDLGQGLFHFITNTDVETAVTQAVADAKRMTMLVIRTKGFKDIFHFEGGDFKVDPDKVGQIEAKLEKTIIAELNERIYSTGIRIANFTLADIDFDKEATRALQQKQIQPIIAEARVLAYGKLVEIGRILSLDPHVGEATLRTQVIAAMERAAELGLLGNLLQGTVLEKLAGVSELPAPESPIIS